MNDSRRPPRGALPFRIEPAPPGKKPLVTAARVVGLILLIGALVTPVVQFMVVTMENRHEARQWRQERAALLASAATRELADRLEPGTADVLPAGGEAWVQAGLGRHPKPHKGAIGRWRKAVHAFWAGVNIYRAAPEGGDLDDLARDVDVDVPPAQAKIYLHPNMPFTVMLLSPFAYLPIWAMALVFTLLKVAAILACFWMVADLAAHYDLKIPDWVLGLGVAWALLFLVGDLQHGNTNALVLLAVVGHLWLFRRGHDVWAGGALAVGVCLKMTPALFAVYWLYQRNWKLLGATVVWGLILAVVVPAVALGPGQYMEYTGSWLENLIIPGLVEGAWYPVHINQSLPGVFSRYFLAEPTPGGNIFWNPDDNPYSRQEQQGWIAFADLSPATVKWLIRGMQVIIVALGAWAIGWRKLPRRDGRRLLHWGIVACGMLLLNQRTWDHHAGVMLLGGVGIWHAIAYGRMGPARRVTALVLAILAGTLHYLTGTEVFEMIGRLRGLSGPQRERFADVADAYGPAFYNFLLVFIVAVILSRALAGRSEPYAAVRQRALEPDPDRGART